MGTTIKSMLNNLKNKDALLILIILNVVVFLLLSIFKVFCLLFNLPIINLYPYLAVASNVHVLVTHAWTLLTYMFIHYSLLHILFNMLMLYWFGHIFRMYFTPKHLVGVYIIGGLFGGLFFVITFKFIPYFAQLGDSYLLGASASVMAIIFAAAFYNKNFEVSVFLIGRVKIIYIALIIFLFDFIALGSTSNQGGHIAHIGGAVFGYLFAQQYLRGRDLTKYFNKMIDFIVNLFKRKPIMRVKYQSPKTMTGKKMREETNRKENVSSVDEIDRILDKIKLSGYSSLTDKEKRCLFDASNK